METVSSSAASARTVELMECTLRDGSYVIDFQFTTDETRVLTLTAGSMMQVDFGVRVPVPEPPPAIASGPPADLPELKLTDAGGLRYHVVGKLPVGSRLLFCAPGAACQPAQVDKHGTYSAEVTLQRGRTRLAQVTAYPDGRVATPSASLALL